MRNVLGSTPCMATPTPRLASSYQIRRIIVYSFCVRSIHKHPWDCECPRKPIRIPDNPGCASECIQAAVFLLNYPPAQPTVKRSGGTCEKNALSASLSKKREEGHSSLRSFDAVYGHSTGTGSKRTPALYGKTVESHPLEPPKTSEP